MKTLDSFLASWGKYQTYLHFLLFVWGFNAGCQALIYSFTMGIPNSRCFLPGNDTDNSTYAKLRGIHDINDYLVYYTEATDEDGQNAYCNYCPNAMHDRHCNKSQAIACDHGMIYDKSQYTSTLAMKFDMVCSQGEWKMELGKSLFAIGVLIGSFVLGSLSDVIGRKKVMIITAFIAVISTNLTPLSPYYEVFGVAQIFNGITQIGCFLVGYTLCMDQVHVLSAVTCQWRGHQYLVVVMEYCGTGSRTAAGMLFQTYFSIGYIYVGLMAYLLRDWQWLNWSVSLCTVFLLLSVIFLPESYRWLASKGKVKESRKIIQRICRWNHLYIPDQVLAEALKSAEQHSTKIDKRANVTDLFKHWSLAKTTLILAYNWLAVSMAYYGLSLNASDLPGDNYTNYFLLGIVEIPAYALSVPMMDKLGRMKSMVILMGVGGSTVIVSAVLPSTISWLTVTLAVVGKMCVAAAFGAVYQYSAELFPTVIRNAGSGFCSLCARIGSIAAPQIHLLGVYLNIEWLAFVLYGAFALLGAVLVVFLPETLGKYLPETIEDGIHYNDKARQRSKFDEERRNRWSSLALSKQSTPFPDEATDMKPNYTENDHYI